MYKVWNVDNARNVKKNAVYTTDDYLKFTGVSRHACGVEARSNIHNPAAQFLVKVRDEVPC